MVVPAAHPVLYGRRRPESTALFCAVQDHMETFRLRAEAASRGVPNFVTAELDGFLRCGILAFGFARVSCAACGYDRLVAFSCKGRGFCPSCCGRRMSDTAAYLVENVLTQCTS